jgi:hypothetical protein
MLWGKEDYRIERWFAGGVTLAAVRYPASHGLLPAVVIFHSLDGNKTDDLLWIALPLADETSTRAPRRATRKTSSMEKSSLVSASRGQESQSVPPTSGSILLPWTSSTPGARLINSAGRSHQ